MKIRIAQRKDAGQMLEIYAPFVCNNVVSFETQLPSLREFELRMKKIMSTYPWLVCEHEGKIIGYTYASRYRERTAYQWSCECSVYVDREFQRKGIASALYSALFDTLKQQGFVNVYAVITHPNPASVKFHKAAGFKFLANYKKVGFKFDRWHDVHWYGKEVNEYFKKPKPPKPFALIKKTAMVTEIIAKYNDVLKMHFNDRVLSILQRGSKGQADAVGFCRP